jgi:putative heme-binding domain-containing protein
VINFADMNLTRICACILLGASSLYAQDGHGVTPADIQRGGQIFLTNCARCHGPNGDAISGVDLASNKFRRAQTDRELTDLIRNGIPGTPMPPGNYTDDQTSVIVAYLHSMANAPRAGAAASTGDFTRGKTIFEGKGQCRTCHRLNEDGDFTGPDLTSIGAGRRPVELERSLLDPNAQIRDANRLVRAVTLDGTVIRGTLLNYDRYSLQLLDTTGKLRSFQTDKLREYELMKTSTMPSYKDKLTTQELADIVRYLVTLKGQAQ